MDEGEEGEMRTGEMGEGGEGEGGDRGVVKGGLFFYSFLFPFFILHLKRQNQFSGCDISLFIISLFIILNALLKKKGKKS